MSSPDEHTDPFTLLIAGSEEPDTHVSDPDLEVDEDPLPIPLTEPYNLSISRLLKPRLRVMMTRLLGGDDTTPLFWVYEKWEDMYNGSKFRNGADWIFLFNVSYHQGGSVILA